MDTYMLSSQRFSYLTHTLNISLTLVTYKLKLPSSWKLHPVFHSNLLSPTITMEMNGNEFTEPPLDIIEGNEEWKVEVILGKRTRGRKIQYKILWKGYPLSEASWEPEENLEHAKDTINDFYHLYPGAPCCLSIPQMCLHPIF